MPQKESNSPREEIFLVWRREIEPAPFPPSARSSSPYSLGVAAGQNLLPGRGVGGSPDCARQLLSNFLQF